jgi:hypothetical protein
MKFKDSGNYQNAFEKHEQRKRKLKEVYQKVQPESLLYFIAKLGISAEDLLRILAGVQGITPELGRKIDLQWIIEFGTAKVPEIAVPEPPVEIKKCTAFTFLSGLEHGDILYLAINYREVLPFFEETETYDPRSLDEIRNFLDDWATTFVRRKDKAMKLVTALKPSISTHFGHECPESRVFEFELFDIETEGTKYKLVYSKGKIVKSIGNLPTQIVSLLKKIGKWEA